jgi:hypothetical protein
MIPAQNLPEYIPTPRVIIHNENPDFIHHFLSQMLLEYLVCRSRESGNPETGEIKNWIPAFAGMTNYSGLFFNNRLIRFEAMFALWGDIHHILCSGFRIRFPGGV